MAGSESSMIIDCRNDKPYVPFWEELQIVLNKAQCNHCGDIIISHHRHDYKECTCGAIKVDGGHEYTKRSYKEEGDIIELSIYQGTEVDYLNGMGYDARTILAK